MLKLMRLHIYLNRKLLMWLTIGAGILFLMASSVSPDMSLAFHLILFVGGILMTTQVFQTLHDSNTSVQALTLPCSSTERYLAAWFLTGPLYFIALTVLYGIAMLIHLAAHSLWFVNGIEPTLWVGLQYLVANAFFLCGAVLFKRLPLLKTLLSLFALFIVFVLIKNSMPIQHEIFWLSLAPIAWLAGYLRLKKIELK